jgi:acetylglutamate kinase
VLDKDGKLLTGLTPSQIDAWWPTARCPAACCPRSARRWTRPANGVKSVHIIDGRVEHCLLLEILTDHGVGTMIKSK